MNPERYSGRNRMSLALRNKMSELWVSGDLGADEYHQIIRRYLAENPSKEKMVKAMASVHTGMQTVAEHLEGGTIDKYQFSMREIRAWASYVNRYAPRIGWTEAFAKGALYLYADRLTTAGDRAKFMEYLKDALTTSGYSEAFAYAQKAAARKISSDDRKAARAAVSGKVRILDVELPVNKAAGSPELVPKKEAAELVMTDSAVIDLEKVAQAVEHKEAALLIGETGAWKTSLVRYLAYLTNNGFQRFNLSGQTEKTDFIGGYHPNEKGAFVWRDGVLIQAMKTGQWLVIDEINLAPSQVVERMNSLLDDDGFIVVTEHHGEKYVSAAEYDRKLKGYMEQDRCPEGAARARLDSEKIFRIHPDFRIFATMNPSEYAGRQVFSPALLNRFRVKWIDEPSREDVGDIIAGKYGGNMDPGLLKAAVRTHYTMVDAARRAPEAEVRYTIRHLLRWIERVGLGLSLGWGADATALFLSEGAAIYGDGLSDEEKPMSIKGELMLALAKEFGRPAGQSCTAEISEVGEKVRL